MTLKAAAVSFVCAAMTVAFASRQPHAVCLSAELPGLDDFTGAASPLLQDNEMKRCMAFLDAHRGAWAVESSNASQLAQNTLNGLPTVQVMRLARAYACTYEKKQAPFLRIVAFLPQVEPSVVYEQVTDIQKRCKWDTNYQLFEGAPDMPSPSPTAPSELDSDLLNETTRPWGKVVKYQRQCRDGVCSREADSSMERFDSQWLVHRLGSAFLSKLGVAERFFSYHRTSVVYRPLRPERVQAYDILYCGAPDLMEEAKATLPHIKAFLETKEAESAGCKPVVINYQHILLLPISSATKQLLENDMQGWKELSNMASMVDEHSCRIFHDRLMESNQLASPGRSERPDSGTLFVITSANCADVPKSMPLWVQSKISSAVAFRTYGALQKACVSQR